MRDARRGSNPGDSGIAALLLVAHTHTTHLAPSVKHNSLSVLLIEPCSIMLFYLLMSLMLTSTSELFSCLQSSHLPLGLYGVISGPLYFILFSPQRKESWMERERESRHSMVHIIKPCCASAPLTLIDRLRLSHRQRNGCFVFLFFFLPFWLRPIPQFLPLTYDLQQHCALWLECTNHD